VYLGLAIALIKGAACEVFIKMGIIYECTKRYIND
jgi:hypothetical protein